jgi:hypothetical protein
MSERIIPREVNIGYVANFRGGTHNVLEVCERGKGVRFVMAQDSETAKERDRYKLRAYLAETQLEESQEARRILLDQSLTAIDILKALEDL